MKKAKTRNGRSSSDEMLPEYDLDAMKSRPNRFAGRVHGSRIAITLDPDVSEVFTSAESVNSVLRALIASMPPIGRKTTI
jgi:hypothetical protein